MKRRLHGVSRGSLVHARGCSAENAGILWHFYQLQHVDDLALREPMYQAALRGARLQWENMG
jgi:hypothetical protein